MHRPVVALIAASLAGCSAQVPQLPRASIKDDTPRLAVEPVSAFQGLKPVAVTGTDQAASRKIALAMFHALNLGGVPIGNPEANWTLSGSILTDAIVWTVRDEANRSRGSVRLTTHDVTASPEGMAQAALAGIKPLLPAPAKKGIRL